MAQMTWESSTKFKGVRWYTKSDRPRLRGNRIDRCFGVRYSLNGARYEAVLGWISEGWSEERAAGKRQEYINNLQTGGPLSPMEEKDLAKKEKAEQLKKDALEAHKNITFKDFAKDEYFPVVEPGWKTETARKHREHCLNWIYPVVGDKSLREIQMQDLNKIRTNLTEESRAPRTMQAVFRTFDMIWTYARDAGIVISASPTKKKSFKLPKIDNERERFLSFGEAENLLKYVKNRSQQAHDMALLSLHTGIRFSEIARLQWQHVDEDASLIHVFDSKGKSRTLEMSIHVVELFNTLERGTGSSLIFPNTWGEIQTQVPSSFKRAIDDAKLNEGITDPKLRFGFHGLRHTRASWLRKTGADLYTIQRILGHTTPVMTQRYAHLEHEEVRDATFAVDNMLEKNKLKKEAKGKKIIRLDRRISNG